MPQILSLTSSLRLSQRRSSRPHGHPCLRRQCEIVLLRILGEDLFEQRFGVSGKLELKLSRAGPTIIIITAEPAD